MTNAPTTAEIKAAARAFSGDIRCSRGGGHTCAKCADKQECSVCYIQRHGRVLVAALAAQDAARNEERDVVVAYLRHCALVSAHLDAPLAATNFQSAASAIERGEHRRREGR
jgi:hypothetical protein